MLRIEDVFGDLPVLETERLILRKLTRDDAEDMFAYARDPEVVRHLPWKVHSSLEDTLTYLNEVLANQEKSQVTSWALICKPEARVVGTAGYNWWQPQHRRAEIGYVLARWLWGRGLMTEAVREIINFGFTRMELNRIQALCREENPASARVMDHCGMKYEGLLRDYYWDNGAPHDFRIYSILQREWKGQSHE